MSLLTNPPGALKTMKEVKQLLKKNRQNGRLYAAPWGDLPEVVTFSFRPYSFMYLNKLCQIDSSREASFTGSHHYDFIRLHGSPIKVTTCAASAWDYSWPRAFVFTNYMLAYAHAV